MSQIVTESGRKATAVVAMVGLLLPTVLLAQQSQTGYTFKAKSELVLVERHGA